MSTCNISPVCVAPQERKDYEDVTSRTIAELSYHR